MRGANTRGCWEPYWKLPAMVPCSLPGVLVTLWIIDRLGRKKTMALCFVIFSLCSLLLFICVGRWVVKPPLSGQQAHFSGHGQWLFGSVSCGLYSWWSSERSLPSPSLGLLTLDHRIRFIFAPLVGLRVGGHFGSGFAPTLSLLDFGHCPPVRSRIQLFMCGLKAFLCSMEILQGPGL